MIINLTYMSGAGNLFSVIDNREYNFDVNTLKRLAPILCKKNKINDFISEGLIAIRDSSKYDFAVDFINPDGSYGAMCGNGGRCAVAFARNLNIIGDSNETTFEMADNSYTAYIDEGTISLKFPSPKRIDLNIKLEINNRTIRTSYVDVGANHVVLEYNKIELSEDFRKFDIDKYGSIIRHHSKFQPKGVNANFYLIENNIVQLRTFERGVEGETGACGTGAIATALICNLNHDLDFPITIIPPSQQILTVDCKFDKEEISEIILSGPAEVLDNKNIEIPGNFFEVKND